MRAGRRLDGPRHAEYRTSDVYYAACIDTGTHRTGPPATHPPPQHPLPRRPHPPPLYQHPTATAPAPPAKAPDVTTEHPPKKNKPRNMTRQQEIERSIDSGTVPARYRKSVPKEYQQYIPFAK